MNKSENISNRAIGSLHIRYITFTAMFAALITIFTAYVCHIPMGANGGYLHFGDSLIYIAATVLPLPYAMLAGAIGGGLADLFTAPMWAPATIIIKALITIPFTSMGAKIVKPRNIIATVLAFMISGTGYFFANQILFGTKVAFFTSITGSFMQSGGSAVFFIIFGLALDKLGFKSKIFRV